MRTLPLCPWLATESGVTGAEWSAGAKGVRIQVVSQFGHHAKMLGALLLAQVKHPLECAERANQTTPGLKLLLIAVIAFGPMDHCFVGTRIQILFSFRCVGGAAVSAESAAR